MEISLPGGHPQARAHSALMVHSPVDPLSSLTAGNIHNTLAMLRLIYMVFISQEILLQHKLASIRPTFPFH